MLNELSMQAVTPLGYWVNSTMFSNVIVSGFVASSLVKFLVNIAPAIMLISSVILSIIFVFYKSFNDS